MSIVFCPFIVYNLSSSTIQYTESYRLFFISYYSKRQLVLRVDQIASSHTIPKKVNKTFIYFSSLSRQVLQSHTLRSLFSVFLFIHKYKVSSRHIIITVPHLEWTNEVHSDVSSPLHSLMINVYDRTS